MLAAAAMLAGLAAWTIFFRADLVLSHYDAKAHLVVARRVIDNLTPGWQQIGAVWLPLPHLIQLLPVQVDLFYRTGLAGSAISILCFGVTAWAFARLVLAATGSAIGATAAVAVLALNPNLLYLQSTPMTEPLLLAVTSLVVLWLYEWIAQDRDRLPGKLALVLFAATWTRYEAWFVVAAAGAAALVALWRLGKDWPTIARRVARLAMWPIVAAVLFVINSRVTVGSWFVTGGFYVPDPLYQGQALRSAVAIWWGTHQLSGYGIAAIGLLGALAVVASVFSTTHPRTAHRASLLIPLAMFAAAALPFYAFYSGHPFRIRYMVPVVAACALAGGVVTGLVARAAANSTRRFAPLLAAALIASALIESPPWDRGAAMLQEAQWDRPASFARRAVTACLADRYRGDKVLASMGSLAHYMQELSWSGFALSDFIHEGNGVIWNAALEERPERHAGWMLVEEQAEGGDVLAQHIRREPAYAAGIVRVCEGGGVALYQRPNRTPSVN